MLAQVLEDHLRPVVMVVEDQPKDLKYRVDHFKEMNCTALGFSHSDDAVQALFTTPGVDLVLTDIDLDGTGSDRSGVHFARLIHEMRLGIPVHGYSAYIDEDSLPAEQKAYFGSLLAKTMPPGEINDSFHMLKEAALDHRRGRVKKLEKVLEYLGEKHAIVSEETTLIRELVLQCDPGLQHIDNELIESGYQLRIIQPKLDTKLIGPILAWIRGEGALFEVEVYGYNELYAYAETEKESVDRLVDLILLIGEDLFSEEDNTFAASTLRLRNYLNGILGE